MERLTPRKNFTGFNGNAMRMWALLFAAAGVIGRGVIQAHMLGVGQVDAQKLLEVMGSSETAMMLATVSLVLQALETCAVPIFATLLVDGVQHTSDFKAYLTRVAGLAVLCEIPYNLAVSAKLFDLSSRNPVFSLVIALILVYFCRIYAEDGMKNRLIRLAVTAAAIVWCEMLKIEFGFPTVLIVAVMWALRRNTLYRNFAGAAAAIVCTVYSPFFLAAPMSFMVIHFYNEEKCTNSRRVNYLAYPAILVIAAAAGLLV